ncbi:MAG: DUF1295 domain-containing protein [Deltaproteobacteria bacterium]|nr:MAG: DUF1295 domain-containing protein [Deltaproteobacteria bacterium]
MDETTFLRLLLWGLVAYGTLAALALLVLPAPYGRHTREGFGPTMPARTAWIVMESPAVVVFTVTYALGAHATEPLPLVFATLWLVHYVHRTFVYPVVTYRPGERPTPLLVVLLGFSFNVANGYANARYLSGLCSYTAADLLRPSLYAGVLLFAFGFSVNRWADGVLRRLKAEGKGYQIPRGGLFTWISCPNYFGEIVEWIGFALATRSPAAWVFAYFTICNLAPRARTHHRWYRERFEDYPKARRALIPGLW